jgi:hypothetical protein
LGVEEVVRRAVRLGKVEVEEEDGSKEGKKERKKDGRGRKKGVRKRE